MRRVLLPVTAVAVGALALPSSAGPPPPITKTYTANALPGIVSIANYCDGVPTTHDKHLEKFTAPAKGTLKVSMPVPTGDWDAMLLDSSGGTVVMSATFGPGDEAYSQKISKPGEYTLMSCNVLGAPSVEVTYTFTYAK